MSEPRIRVGCADLPAGLRWDRYWAALDYIERATTFNDVPKLAAARRWRAATPAGVGSGLIAWQGITHAPGPRGYPHSNTTFTAEQLATLGDFRDSPLIRDATTRLGAIAQEIEAEAVVFRTPSTFTPSSTNRERIEHFFSEIATAEVFGDAALVWEPQGLWEPRQAARLASGLGLLFGCDPLTRDPLDEDPGLYSELGEAAYFRLTGLGSKRNRFQEHELEELVEIAQGYERCWLVFGNVAAFNDARWVRNRLAATGEPDEPGS